MANDIASYDLAYGSSMDEKKDSNAAHLYKKGTKHRFVPFG